MKSELLGVDTSLVEVTNISRHGLWLLVGEEELFLPFDEFPWFMRAALADILNVELHGTEHLHWPALDIDLTLDSIRHPENDPLVSKAGNQTTGRGNPFVRPSCYRCSSSAIHAASPASCGTISLDRLSRRRKTNMNKFEIGPVIVVLIILIFFYLTSWRKKQHFEDIGDMMQHLAAEAVKMANKDHGTSLGFDEKSIMDVEKILGSFTKSVALLIQMQKLAVWPWPTEPTSEKSFDVALLDQIGNKIIRL